MFEDTELINRWKNVVQEVGEACVKSGRRSEEVTLIAVSKKHTVQAISTLAREGQMDFGENYVQEALAKIEELSALQLNWHFIGHLQSNKVKHVLGKFVLIHTLDSEKLAQVLHKKAKSQGFIQPVLIQVNVGQETQKFGVSEDNLFSLVEQMLSLDNLKLQGLMTLPPFFEQAERVRPYFVRLRELKEELEQRFELRLPHLSMGMTSDFAQAIAEGATLVRIGTRIFGPRY
ncbi:YggS family pyridoxal phosphate-dependent enzyme [Desulfovulcanus sp.]